MTPFRRLALFAASAAVVGALGAVAHYVSGFIALEMLIGGFLFAFATTLEVTPRGDTGKRPAADPSPPAAIRPRLRADIASRAGSAEDDDEL